ncbi:piggyBac transposable element-derived protein 4 [Trichonephila clavipes]|nr:piggyBac transposable element-derived protein 4 [Trichonephila clavipes]
MELSVVNGTSRHPKKCLDHWSRQHNTFADHLIDLQTYCEGILKSHSLSSLLNYLRAFGDGLVAGVLGGQGIESCESDDDCLDSARDWCQIDVTSPLPSHPKFPFTGNPGIKVCIGDSGDHFEYFNLFLDDEMFSFIVEETNRYAESFFENAELTPGSRALKWKNTNKEERKIFIALLLLQGVKQKPVEQWFGSKRPILSTPFFGKVMGEVRYGLLMKFLHFANNESSSDLDHNTKLKKKRVSQSNST